MSLGCGNGNSTLEKLIYNNNNNKKKKNNNIIYTKMWDLAPDFGSLTTGGIAGQRGQI